ncbi:MAG: hypothetical protein K9N07_11315, partial [Candidatus Cloacimonetes bacterium]|nr:hypothetical protein [Candidatus Cloacimonadota bacterium]
MKTKMNLVILLFLLLICNSLLAYSDLRVHDPRGWHSAQGTIESATASIKPKGVYMEIGLYLTFSAKGWNYSSQDSLEILFNFTLPDNAIVHDSWLWVGEDIIRGEIMDKWTASEIYEDIVKRRQDPSILFKYNSTTYELKIYPMLASETRKVKITYLVPAQFNSNYILADLPTDLLRASRYPLSEFHILTWLDDEWKNPNIQEYPEIVFESFSDSTFGNYVRADIPTEAINNSLHFSLNSPLKNGVYLSATGDQAEGIYQLAFLPSEIINDSNSIKVALLFDYQEENCHESTIEILNTVKSYLLSNLSAADSLNLIFSNIEIKRASEHWFSADSASIEEVFEGLETNPFSNYSNLPSLLADGIEFINSNGNKGELVLISSSDQVGNYKVANELIDDLATLMESEITISVCDFQSQSWPSYYFGGRYYYGNEYFNKNITRMTSGNYYNRRSGESFLNVLSNTIGSVGGFISSFDMYTTLQNGYCYSRFNLGSQTSVVQLNKPLIQ